MQVVKRKRSGSDRRVVKRHKPLAKSTVKAVTKIAKKVLKQDAELKYFSREFVTEINPQAHKSWNLFYEGVNRGTDDNQVIGDKLRWKGVAIKYRIVNGYYDISWNYSAQPIVLDFYVVRIPHYYTTANVPLNTIHNGTTTDANIWFVNDSCTVLSKKTVKITPNTVTNQANVKNGRMWIRRDQTIEFKDLGTGHDLKNGLNYYLIIINRSLAGNRCNIQFSWQNYFIDA